MQKFSLATAFLMASLFAFNACKKSDDSPNSASTEVKDTVTSFFVYFANTSDSMVEVGNYDDPDGPGPMQATISGVSLKANSTYEVTFSIKDETNQNKIEYIDSKIKSQGKDFKICIGNPLGITVQATDSDGSMPIGLENILNTSSSKGDVKLNFTIKNQKGVKDGTCSPGEVYFSFDMPISVL
ncbi:MAG: hypothetical protein R2852_05425 [Bacteroidia bacterium]